MSCLHPGEFVLLITLQLFQVFRSMPGVLSPESLCQAVSQLQKCEPHVNPWCRFRKFCQFVTTHSGSVALYIFPALPFPVDSQHFQSQIGLFCGSLSLSWTWAQPGKLNTHCERSVSVLRFARGHAICGFLALLNSPVHARNTADFALSSKRAIAANF